MAKTKTICTHCQSPTIVDSALGERFTCPQCRRVFTLSPGSSPDTDSTSPSPQLTVPAPRVGRSPTPSRRQTSPLLIPIAVLLMVGTAVAAGAIVYGLLPRDETENAQAKNNEPATNSPSNLSDGDSIPPVNDPLKQTNGKNPANNVPGAVPNPPKNNYPPVGKNDPIKAKNETSKTSGGSGKTENKNDPSKTGGYDAPNLPKGGVSKTSTNKKDTTVTVKKDDNSYRNTLTVGQQKLVNAAVDKGVKYLLGSQQPDGKWAAWTKYNYYHVSYAALPALTLLECGVPASDPVVQKAANFVRAKCLGTHYTYDISLAILLLDKLGEKKDADLIRFLGLRLAAGQTVSGGWSYDCPMIDNAQASELDYFLKQTRPAAMLAKSTDKTDGSVPGNNRKSPIEVDAKDDGDKKSSAGKPGGKGIALPFPKGKKKTDPGNNKPSAEQPKAQPKVEVAPLAQGEPVFKPFPFQHLKTEIKTRPIVRLQPRLKANEQRKVKFKEDHTEADNSNTQFAVMALWVARRYGVPVERSMALIEQRYLSSQNKDGGWGYFYIRPTRITMVCVGLIGLGVAHGSYKETWGPFWESQADLKSPKEDPAIQKALKLMAKSVGNPPADWNSSAEFHNLYFVWSVERVAMLYNMKLIGEKDWYGWAAHMLVKNQQADGSWNANNYEGACTSADTCLALLVLKRANLVQDLTHSLNEYVPIRESGVQNPPDSRYDPIPKRQEP